jgi:hypothetical protein
VAWVTRCPLGGVVAVECKHRNIATIRSPMERWPDQVEPHRVLYYMHTFHAIAVFNHLHRVAVLSARILDQHS